MRDKTPYIMRDKTPEAATSLVSSVFALSSAFRRIRKTIKVELGDVECGLIDRMNRQEVDCLRYMLQYYDAMS